MPFVSFSEWILQSKLVWSLANVRWQSRVLFQFPHLVLWSSNLISWAARLHRLVTKATFFCYFFSGYIYWLVVWTILIFPYIGNNSPNWLTFFRSVLIKFQVFESHRYPQFFWSKDDFFKMVDSYVSHAQNIGLFMSILPLIWDYCLFMFVHV